MKLHGVIDIRLEGETVLRDPSFWDKIKRSFGKTLDLRTDRVRTAVEAAALVEGARRALERLGVTNAISLSVDKQVLFEDKEGRADDLIDLMIAFHDNASVFGTSFELLRLVVEHEEAGLRMVIEVMARSEHPANETAARVVIGGRIRDFEPEPGESAEAFRARVEPMTKTPAIFEAHRMQFESFVSRVAEALDGSLPDAEVSIREAQAKVEQPAGRPDKREPIAPTDQRYDPYDVYYPSPMPGLLSMVMFSSMLSWAMMPSYAIINPAGALLGSTDSIGSGALASLAGGEMPTDAAFNAFDNLGFTDPQAGTSDLGGGLAELGEVGDLGGGDALSDFGDLGGFDFSDW